MPNRNARPNWGLAKRGGIVAASAREKALLRYNGCVRGRDTPNCHTYPNKVLRYSRTAASQMVAELTE